MAAARFRWHTLSPWRGWLLAWALASLLVLAWQAQSALTRLRESAETDARIVHRLLSQRAAQHDAILATLTLLQPGDGAQQRLPAVYPQVLAVHQRPRGARWPDADLAVADERSRRLGHATVARFDREAGRMLLVQHGEPASHALLIDLRAMVPSVEWPLAADAPVRVALVPAEVPADAFVLQPGDPGQAQAPWPWTFRKRLAAPSQPFDVVLSRGFGGRDLPWGAMLAALAGVTLAVVVAAAVRQQQTARRRAEDLLRLGQVARLNALGELAVGIAHELNQPLTAVLASAQAARRLRADGAEMEEAEAALLDRALDQTVAQARRASEVLQRLRRSVERPDAGRVAQPVALDTVVADTLHLLAPEAARCGVAPQVHAGTVPVVVVGDAVALQQIVHNLVMNALQALGQVPAAERHLVLTLDIDGLAGRLQVADTGPGIAPEALPRLFEPFFTTRPGGLGLGLSLCEGLAHGMGGSLAAEARPPRGACFTLRLPLQTDPTG
jgi:signal transduction histidine kinase